MKKIWIVWGLLLASSPIHAELICPVDDCGRISARFGKITHSFGFSNHNGIDLPLPVGTPVVASADGKVLKALEKGGYGKHIVIQHEDEFRTLYANLSSIQVQDGQLVKQGEVIGYTGNTGVSTGPHIHIGVFKGDEAVDPKKYF